VAADSKAKLLSDAEKFVLQGKIPQAITEYLKVVSLDPEDVLILNTIGDLYLRQKNRSEANKYFARVADSYVRNNFFLKAIAVYKKILSADPNNLEINSTMASLYAKQGLSIDARTQYLKIAELLENEGRTREVLETYEKIVELDPSNFKIQRKLAELHFTAGERDVAQTHWVGAARAQTKAGDLDGAIDSFERAMQLAPLDIDAMGGFLECCLKKGDVSPALNQLKKSVDMAPQNLDLREMLGQAFLESGDIEIAAKTYQMIVSLDETRYESFFPVAKAFIERNAYDQSIAFLDNIIPILITRRETDRAAKLYEQILQRSSQHIPALIKLASLYSATGDQPRYLEALDQISDYYLNERRLVEALEYLEKIIQTDPTSEKHRGLHKQVFDEAYPDTPYTPPVDLQTSSIETGPASISRESLESSEGSSSAVLEVDLLLNYGLKDKALSLLKNIESRDPYDKDVRNRLASLYKSENKFVEAAEQCLLLVVLHRRAKNEESAQYFLSEAKQLAPDVVAYETDLDALARRKGIVGESTSGMQAADDVLKPVTEVDLSSDLLDVFFGSNQESSSAEDSAPLNNQELMAEGYPQDVPSSAASKSIEEQLQEVDFYIRLGFNDEARTKLNELAKNNPNDPELASRYEKLGESQPSAPSMPIIFESAPTQDADIPATDLSDSVKDFRSLDFSDTMDGFMESAREETKPSKSPSSPIIPLKPAPSNPVIVNDMFADLMEEVVSPDSLEEAKESFEEHFSLGTAYREMELTEEAIKEFEIALKSIAMKKGDQRVIQCCGMLSTCFIKKSMPRSALRWCQTGLSLADAASHEAMALRYDMGIAHAMDGSAEQALECFDQIFNSDPGYRDVAKRIDELKGGSERNAP
jgi:tetratricopeptide (TPR) repeat protein